MTQTNCPRCGSSQTLYHENYGYWDCDICGNFWALDADDPDYDDTKIDDATLRWCWGAYVDNQSLCAKCNGGGLIQVDGEMLCCPRCGGDGRSPVFSG